MSRFLIAASLMVGVTCLVARSIVDVPGLSPTLQFLSLDGLPEDLRESLSLILLLPVGALVNTVFRVFFGFRTFGYFTTSLLAVSFVHVDWRTGIAVFGVITLAGLLGRVLVGRLDLAKLPRVGLMLLLISVSLVVMVCFLHSFAPGSVTRGLVLPMVCLTLMVERFHINLEQMGYRFALRKLVGTLVVAFLTLLIFRADRVQQTISKFPEVEFFVAAAFVLVGRYQKLLSAGTAGVQSELEGDEVVSS